VTFGVFLVATICYACITPAMEKAQIVYNVLMGVGQSGPLTLIVALVQFTAPHAYLSTATGLAFSARALGGAFGSAVVGAIINGKLSRSYAAEVGSAAVAAGLPQDAVAPLLAALASGSGSREALSAVAGATSRAIDAALSASRDVYAAAYRLGWSSIIPFVVLAWSGIWFTRGVKNLMTDVVEASIERRPESHRSSSR